MAKKEQNTKFKKAPQAPRRFKSAYMFFSTEKHKSIRKEHGKKLQTTDVAKMVSQAWKNLPPEEREEWEEMARRDKARYEVEKTMYTGPWKVPATKARSQKDPNAPKRPMSAFLSYSNSKRAAVKANNPDIGNAEVSRILAKMWKDAPEDERKMHIDKEFELRQEYKSAIAIWRQNADEELKRVRKKREEIALERLDAPDNSFQAGGSAEARPLNHMAMDGQCGGPTEVPDGSMGHTKSPPMPGGVGGPNPAAPYASMGQFGMGFNSNNTMGDDSALPHLPPPPPQQQAFGSFGPPPPGVGATVAVGCGGGPMVPGGGGLVENPAAAYGVMQAAGCGPYPDAYPTDYGGMPPSGFDPGYNNANMVGFYGAYYPPPPQMQMQMPQPDHNGMVWGGQFYGNRNAQHNPAPDASSGYGYGGY